MKKGETEIKHYLSIYIRCGWPASKADNMTIDVTIVYEDGPVLFWDIHYRHLHLMNITHKLLSVFVKIHGGEKLKKVQA